MLHTEQCTKEATSLQSSAYKRFKPNGPTPHYNSLFYDLSTRSVWDSEVSTPKGKASPITKSDVNNMIVIDMRQ